MLKKIIKEKSQLLDTMNITYITGDSFSIDSKS